MLNYLEKKDNMVNILTRGLIYVRTIGGNINFLLSQNFF